MPKIKTHSGTKKRVKVTKSKRLKRWRSGHNHMLIKKTHKRKMRLKDATSVDKTKEYDIKRLLGMK